MKIQNLQALRGLAALMVVAFHSAISENTLLGSNSVAGAWFRSIGYGGVDVFFVISGFIMVFICKNRPISLKHFMRDRFVRVVPIYWAHLLLYVAVIFIFTDFVAKKSHSFELAHNAASFAFLSQALLGKFPTVQVGWTLELEMIFYTIVAVTLVTKNKLAKFALLLGGVAIASYWMPIVVEFLFGASLGYLLLDWNGGSYFDKFYAVVFSLLSALLAFVLLKNGANIRILQFGVPAAIIVAVCIKSYQIKSNAFTRLGDYSYSLYLSHWFVTPAFYGAVNFVFPSSSSDWGMTEKHVALFCCIFVCIVLGALVYAIAERPIISHLNRHS